MITTVAHQYREEATSEPSTRLFRTIGPEAALAGPRWHAVEIGRSKREDVVIVVPRAMNTNLGEPSQTLVREPNGSTRPSLTSTNSIGAIKLPHGRSYACSPELSGQPSGRFDS